MKKIRMGICLVMLAGSLSACSAEPPDLYMIPNSEKTVSGEKPLIVLEEDEELKREKEHSTDEPATVSEPDLVAMNQSMYVVDGVNIRTKNDLNAPVVSSLEKGLKVQVTGKCSNGWYQIEEQGGIAYIKEEFLSETMPELQLADAETTEVRETTQPPETTKAAETTSAAAQPPETAAETSEPAETATEATTEPETTGKPIDMINTYSLTGVITDIGSYGFTVQGKDKQSLRFSCSPDMTAGLTEGGYVVVKYNTSAASGETELISVSGQ